MKRHGTCSLRKVLKRSEIFPVALDTLKCLAYIKEVWTDMRPLSLRKTMEQAAAKS